MKKLFALLLTVMLVMSLSACGISGGTPLGGAETHTHTSYGSDVFQYCCDVCNEFIGNGNDIANIIDITNLNVNMNSVGGLDVYIDVKNKSKEHTIKYIHYNLSFYNAVGDKIYCEIKRDDNVTLTHTGPINPGKTKDDAYWDACFYNTTYGNTLCFNWIEIEYTSGEKILIESPYANSAVVRWR